MEVVSFGTLSKLFCNFKNVKVKKQVAIRVRGQVPEPSKYK